MIRILTQFMGSVCTFVCPGGGAGAGGGGAGGGDDGGGGAGDDGDDGGGKFLARCASMIVMVSDCAEVWSF